jgi:hypothetical protein
MFAGSKPKRSSAFTPDPGRCTGIDIAIWSGGILEMMRSGLICLLLAALAWGQSTSSPSGAPPQVVETKPPAATQVAPDAAVITIRGLCDHPPADKTTAAPGCSTVFTRAQFEALVGLIQPNLPPAQRKQLATNYANALILAEQARQMGLDKGPRFEELVKLQRLGLLRQLLSQALEEKASQIPDKDIADYYTENSSAYEEVELERLYIPRAQQLEAPKEKITPEETQKRQLDAQAVMKKEAADLRARAAAGEDIAKLQEEAYKTAGFKIAPPPAKMEKHRRSSLPPAQVSVMELKSGEISPVIEDVNGYFIYKVGEKNMLPLDQVRSEISNTLRTQRVQQYMRAAEQSATTTLNEEYFTVPPPSAAPAMSLPRGAPPATKTP